MIKIKLLIFLLAISINGFSQYDFKKGFIVINKDTIPGLIDHTNPNTSSNYCFFKADSNDSVIKYTPNEINAYGTNDSKLFVSKNVTIENATQKVFLEYLVDGIVDLYYCKRQNNDLYFIEKNNILYPLSNDIVEIKENGKIMVKESHKYLGILNLVMSDAEEIKSEINSTKLSHNSLIELSKDYHDMVCIDEKCIVYYKKQKKLNDAKWQFDFGIVFDYVMSRMDLDVSFNKSSELRTQTFYNSNTGHYEFEEKWIEHYKITETNAQFTSFISGISPGIYLNINRNSRSSIQIQLKYQFMKNSALEFHKIQVPVLITYDFVRYKKVIPYVILGLGNDFYLKIKTTKQLYAEYDYLTDVVIDYENTQIIPVYSQDIVYYEDRNIMNKTYSPVLLNGVGLSYNLPNHNKVKLDIIGSLSFFKTITTGTIIISELYLTNIALSLRYEF